MARLCLVAEVCGVKGEEERRWGGGGSTSIPVTTCCHHIKSKPPSFTLTTLSAVPVSPDSVETLGGNIVVRNIRV